MWIVFYSVIKSDYFAKMAISVNLPHSVKHLQCPPNSIKYGYPGEILKCTISFVNFL